MPRLAISRPRLNIDALRQERQSGRARRSTCKVEYSSAPVLHPIDASAASSPCRSRQKASKSVKQWGFLMKCV